MKKIIVPVDFSEYSENALKVAAKIAKDQSAEIIVVHMMGLNTGTLSKETSPGIEGMFYVKLTRKRFEEFLDKEYLNDLTIHQVVKNHTVFNKLDLIAQEHDADLIIMGSHGSSGLSEVFVGSNTEKVVRTANTPVLVIKDITDSDMRKAVFACDFKKESLKAFKTAMSIFNSLKIEVNLVFINLSGDHFLSTKDIDKRILDFIVQVTEFKILQEDVAIYCDYIVENGIFNYAEKVKADLISLPTHGRRGLAHFFSGSIGEDIVNHSKLPVLTVRMAH